MIKRIFDFVFSLFGLIITMPLFLIIAVLVQLDSGLPIFYGSLRVGRFGKKFKMYKFRTMIKNADKIGPSSTASDDLRLTRIGKFLKKYQLDELPQLINVLKGEMSLVGPRPQVPWAVELYSLEEKSVLNMRPGMTDWASLWNFHEGEILRGSKNPDKDYMEKIHSKKMKLGLEYIKEHSFLTDIKIIFKTIKAIINRN